MEDLVVLSTGGFMFLSTEGIVSLSSKDLVIPSGGGLVFLSTEDLVILLGISLGGVGIRLL